MKFLKNNIEIIISLLACFFIFIVLVISYEDKIKSLENDNKNIKDSYYMDTNIISLKVNNFISNDITEVIIDKEIYYVNLPKNLYNLELNKNYTVTFNSNKKYLKGEYSQILNNNKVVKVVMLNEKN